VLLILDEVQSGLGRTGRWFAFQHEGIRPDGLILGKALGGGLLPVSCFVATNEVMGLFEPGSHGSTFGGNPLAAAVGLEALNVIDDEGVVARSASLGAHLFKRLQAINSRLIRAVRGRGLWVGVDLDPALASARAVVERMAERGVLTKDTHETVIRFAPPLTIQRAALDWGIDMFIETLREFEPDPVHDADHSPVVLASKRATARTKGERPAAPSAHLMMSAPDFFEVSYRINPWMDPANWSVSADRLARDARNGWAELKRMYESLGARIDVQPPARGLPDMVFTANAAVVLDRKVMLARFLCPERQGEEAHNRAFFEAQRAAGIVDSIVTPPEGLYFEGAGDAIWDRSRGVLWTGYGQRSSRDMHRVLAETYGVPAVSLELVDPRFYHLDTCFCVLPRGEILWFKAALSPASQALVEELAGRDRLIDASEDDAHHLAVNSVSIGNDVVLCHASERLRAQLRERGYRPHVVSLDSFNRSGGAAYCLTLRLDVSTRPEARREPVFAGEVAPLRVAA
jgi:N-dimethylarginine dimethylaminohydrolase